MLVFIPVFLYALFLDDLLRYALDAQEAAVATVWDYTIQNWAEKEGGEYGGFSQVQGFARQMYCDHESGVDSYDNVAFDCQGETHHQHAALTSHPCWLNTGAQQVECQGPDKDVGSLGVPIHSSYFDEFNHGGLIRCSARIGVQNYMLPQTLFPEFSDVDLAKEQQSEADGVHSNAGGDTGGTKTYLMPTEQMSILTDTWAINDDVTIEPGDKSGSGTGGEHFYAEVKSVYQDTANLGYPMLLLSTTQFFGQAISKQLLSPIQVATMMASDADSPIKADNPRSPNVSIKPFTNGMQTPSQKVEQAGQSRYFYNSEWRDWDKNNPQQSYGNRGVSYMGCKQPESC
ncbi:hypothetical protein OV208_23170 [Corallococcus sp. bb12-1]|uniref:hypothetical protein n=1 Tax=Corallococcus sp. bb12-1 TaxID=2996784 RepID=UPI00226D96F7|nr:hypothetical protein [Corallococcus sp. bb12-1]MCY1044239.1 hypothetical protein [Corallococcus sp. bb12-1]